MIQSAHFLHLKIGNWNEYDKSIQYEDKSHNNKYYMRSMTYFSVGDKTILNFITNMIHLFYKYLET